MDYVSNFNFLKDKKGFKDIYSMCMQFEKNIIMQCFNSALMTGRVISELLIIKLGLKDKYIRKNLLVKENSHWKIKKYTSLENVILSCYNSQENILDYDTKETYFSIKFLGNLNAHGVNINQFGLSHCKDMHAYIFEIAVQCFNQFFDIDVDKYEYNLDNVDTNVKFNSDEVFNFLNNIHENEINTKNFIDYINDKKIFLTIDYFDDLIFDYRDEILDKGNFESELKKYKWIDDSNIQIFMDSFDLSISQELFSKLTKSSEENLAKIIEVLRKQDEYLTIKDIEEMKGDENSLIYEHIKKLSDNFFSDSLNGIINELKSVMVEKTDEETKEIINKLKNYETDFDDYGFTIKQVDKNILLDDEQEEAVYYAGNKPLIINAGPGSGKTRVITERVRFLVKKKKVDPSSILVITFTNEATNELKNRLKYETDLEINIVNQMRISTIHSFCRYLISKYEDTPYSYLNRLGEKNLFIDKYKEDLGFTGPYSIFGTDLPSVSEKYNHYFSFGINTDEFVKYISDKNKVTDDYLDYIDEYFKKSKGKFPTFNQIRKSKMTGPHYFAKYQRIAESYPKYIDLLEEKKSCDDNYLLEKGCQILSYVGTDYKNILIDEFQDTDYHLKNIIDKLKENADSFTIVGDLDQSIYGFRGADSTYFEEYINDKENNKQVGLQTNYRSTRDIVEFCEEFIEKDRHDDKKLKPIKQYSSPVYHLSNYEELDEFKNLVYIIRDLKKKNKIKYYSDVLVLFTSHFKINNFVEQLDLFEIPYYIDNKKDFLEQNEIKAILTLYWYLLDFNEFRLPYERNISKGLAGNNFLNFYGFTDELYNSSEFFKLSDKTQEVLSNIQKNYEDNIVNEANDLYFEKYGKDGNLSYVDVFEEDNDFIESVMRKVDKKSLIELNEMELINLGIEDKNDIKFFLKLKKLKSQMNSENYNDRPTTLKLFKEFITMTNFYGEISLRNPEEAVKINNDISLLSNIIKDYENIMGNKNYYGLFNYLNKVLPAYSSASNELEDEMDKVHVRTIHKSKGLEYPVVIIGSLGTTYYPSGKINYSFPKIITKREEDEQTIDHYPFQTPIRFLKRKPKNYVIFNNLEEIRKIYVGMTRAKEILILSTIGQIPDFINRIKDSNVNFEKFHPTDVSNLKKIETSKIINKKNLIKELSLEKILKDYLFCQFRYDLTNNLKLELDISDNNFIDMVAHNLLGNIHTHNDKNKLSIEDVEKKIRDYIECHNISSYEQSLAIINNIANYWRDTGVNYKILENNIPITFAFESCELNGVIDLVIQGSSENKISIVQFICTDKRMNNKSLNFYKMLYHFYPFVLKEFDEFKDKEIENIIVYSLSNNKIHEFEYVETYEKQCLTFLESITNKILTAKFDKNGECERCEYRVEFCKK